MFFISGRLKKLFPKKYYNQVSLAESQLAALADEDDIYPHKASLLFTHKIQGKKGTEVYYSFKMTDSDEGEFLGFIGPYSKDELLPANSTLQYQISFDTPFTKAAVNSLFKIFLEEKAEE